MSDRKRLTPRRLTPAVRETFLAAIREGWTVKHAAERAGHPRRVFYELRTNDEAFREAWEEAVEVGTDVLEDELRRRATEGWTEDTFDGEGNLVRRVERYAPQLLTFLLKGRRPAVYGDNAHVEITGHGGGPVELQAGYEPTTLQDVLRLAVELGVMPDVVDGEAVEVMGEIESAG